MIKIDFGADWKYRRTDGGEWSETEIPHDAAMYEKRTKDAEAGENTGWYLGADYEYVKTFSVHAEYEDKDEILESRLPPVRLH